MKKMNNIFIYILSLGLFVLLSSCDEDKLDIEPEIGSPLENVITNENDMRMVLVGVYTRMNSSSGFSAAVSIFGDLLSDNTFVSNDNDGYFLNTSRLSYSAEISDFSMYDSFYDVIQQANMVIGDKVLDETETVLDYKAEAKIARAMAYFYLVSFYSPDPKSGVNQEYGVPIQPEAYDPNYKLARASVGEVYDYIISDLESAIARLTNDPTPGNKSDLNATAAKLLLSRIYLTRGATGDYQKSINYANDVISVSPGFQSQTDYIRYFNSTSSLYQDNQEETIFEIEQTSLFNVGGNAHPASFYASNGAHKSLLFRPSFFDIFKQGDWRLQFKGTLGSALDTPQGFFCRKWVRFTEEGNYASNIKLLRFSEAYLNRIEALFKSGDLTTALNYLNEFQSKRGLPGDLSSISLESILDERRREFFAEGYRFFDLKRNGLSIVKDSNCSDNCTVNADNRIFVIPIPYYEININPNIAQYPGW